jgi:hypothetical protein
MFKTEKKTQSWLGYLILVLSLIYVLTSLGKVDWIIWFAVAFGVFLSIFLLIEGGVYDYWRSKGYKEVTAHDFLVWLTMFVAGAVFLNSIALISVIKDMIPSSVLGFLSTIGVTTAVIAGILGMIYIIVPKPKS